MSDVWDSNFEGKGAPGWRFYYTNFAWLHGSKPAKTNPKISPHKRLIAGWFHGLTGLEPDCVKAP